ncbi:hypothetical protein BDV95DRAFT_487603 [Massariosphaeria phaeospora]|uniref:2,6-dihydroxypyridine 3-monooxygenase substrate binding domain-containing protein n=1 Tax=Massariosphaeria phaeospora TaxID=100035 RepID=A0A7C8M8V5_9PLEO|nr:hypothetical protein BDV95DRAFT_487603 [Massariosphaeria phaeospora]
MPQATPKDIVIVGGSLGGLFTGLALKRLRKNLNVRIFERNPTALLHDQGAGVVAGQDTQDLFRKYDRNQTPLTVTSRQRLYLDKSGNVIDREDSVQQMTSWDLMYHILRANFDGIGSEYAKPPGPEEDEGTAVYEYGCTVTDIDAPPPSASQAASAPINLIVKRHFGETFTTTADLVIAADGPSSTVRSLYFPDVQRTYAGYVAWRGTVPETQISASATQAFAEKFIFFHTTGIQILAYLIPGHNGTLAVGERLVNWVWYVNYAKGSPEHTALMTDNSGKKHHVTLPPGGIRDDIWTRQKERATAVLPPQFAELVNKTEVPFIQAITDAIAPSAVLSSGRVLLLGDALANFRPHTAASTGQAAMDAMALAEAVGLGAGERELAEWEKKVVGYAEKMQRRGVELGERSQFGVHPLRG